MSHTNLEAVILSVIAISSFGLGYELGLRELLDKRTIAMLRVALLFGIVTMFILWSNQ